MVVQPRHVAPSVYTKACYLRSTTPAMSVPMVGHESHPHSLRQKGSTNEVDAHDAIYRLHLLLGCDIERVGNPEALPPGMESMSFWERPIVANRENHRFQKRDDNRLLKRVASGREAKQQQVNKAQSETQIARLQLLTGDPPCKENRESSRMADLETDVKRNFTRHARLASCSC